MSSFVSLSFSSSSSSFGGAVALLDSLSVNGVRVRVCGYTGAADCSIQLLPAAVPFFEAICRLAFEEKPGYDYDFEFVADYDPLGSNHRYLALQALIYAANL